MKIDTLIDLIKRESRPGPHLTKRSHLKKGMKFKLVGRPIVYTFPNGVKIGLTEWLN